METLLTIISSGIVSLIISVASLSLLVGKYKQKVDTHEKNIDEHGRRISEISDRISKAEGGIDRDRAYMGADKPATSHAAPFRRRPPTPLRPPTSGWDAFPSPAIHGPSQRPAHGANR